MKKNVVKTSFCIGQIFEKSLFRGLFFLLGLSLLGGLSAAQASAEAQLKEVKSQRQGQMFRIDLHFDRPVSGQELTVDFINETVQVNVAGASIPQKKKFDYVKDDEQVKHLYTYQTEQGLRHRIILQPGNSALAFEDKVYLQARGSVLSIEMGEREVVKNQGLDSILRALPAKKRIAKSKESVQVSQKAASVRSKSLNEEEQALFSAVTKNKAEDPKKVTTDESPVTVAEASEGRQESEIPLFRESEAKVSSSESPYMRMVLSLIIVLAMAGGIFLITKKYSHRQLSKNKHTSIRVMTQHYLGPKKSLAIVSVAGESILIGITDQTITPIKTLSLLEEEIPAIEQGEFSQSLETSMKGNSATKNEVPVENQRIAASPSIERQESPAMEDEFSIQGIKDIVKERLNGMRNI